jgi:DNA replication protein DnaC
VKFGADTLAAMKLPDLTDAEWAERDAGIQAELEAQEAALRATEEKAARVRVLEGGAPERAVRDSFAGWFDVGAESVQALRDFHTDERGIRILAGGVGSGKTLAAIRWLAEYGGSRPVFLRVSEFETVSRYDKEARARWKGATALVFDDLGAEYADAKGNFLADLDELIDVYAGRFARLIITTNLDLNQFRGRYKARIVSRMRANARWKSLQHGDRRVAK